MNASGFSKEIQEFDQVLDEINNEKMTNDANGEENCQNNDLDDGKCQNNEVDDDKLEEELYDRFDESMHLTNKQFKAFRDPKEDDKDGLSSSDEEGEEDDAHSCTTTTSTIMDSSYVRSKVRKSLLSKMKTERRRIRNKGESALNTEKNRELNDNIKASIHFFK